MRSSRYLRYTQRQRGKEQANRYLLTLNAMCADLAEAPQQAQSCAYIRPGYRRRSFEHHIIYFRPMSNSIVIVRILHQHMDAARHM